jgi:transposase
MIPREREQEILRLHHAEGWLVGTIARQLGVHHDTVARVLAQAGLDSGKRFSRKSKADPYIPFIEETLKKYPDLRASRLFGMAKERGYPGGPDHFRHIVSRYRPRPTAEAYLSLKTLPGEQAQVDWGHFGKVVVGKATRPLMAFFMVLSWSRRIFLRFFLGQAMGCFLRGHVDAFSAFGGVPRVILTDNLKSVVLERRGDAIRFHPRYLELAAFYRFEPRPVAVARGNEKGRVERMIQYARHGFFAARTWGDVADLNRQSQDWCETEAAQRLCPGDRSLTVAQAFEKERPLLLPIPDPPFPAEERVEVSVRKQPYVTFDRNQYSVPHDRVRRTLVVLANEDTVRVLDGATEVAHHPRSYDRSARIENPKHIEALVAWKREARESRGMDRLHRACPISEKLLVAVAERGGNVGSATSRLLYLLEAYGPADLEACIRRALAAGASHVAAVEQCLDQLRQDRKQPPPLPLTLPPGVQDVVVKPHSLDEYDPKETHDDDDNDPTAV